jgi:hypothetical protein
MVFMNSGSRQIVMVSGTKKNPSAIRLIVGPMAWDTNIDWPKPLIQVTAYSKPVTIGGKLGNYRFVMIRLVLFRHA